MQRTGPTKIETQKTISALEKHGKKTKHGIFLVIAEELSKPRRARVSVNLNKLSVLAKANEKKILVVPGKVLSFGNVEQGMTIAAFSFSEEAKKKIIAAKGKAMTLKELIDGKQKVSEMVLVK